MRNGGKNQEEYIFKQVSVATNWLVLVEKMQAGWFQNMVFPGKVLGYDMQIFKPQKPLNLKHKNLNWVREMHWKVQCKHSQQTRK